MDCVRTTGGLLGTKGMDGRRGAKGLNGNPADSSRTSLGLGIGRKNVGNNTLRSVSTRITEKRVN